MFHRFAVPRSARVVSVALAAAVLFPLGMAQAQSGYHGPVNKSTRGAYIPNTTRETQMKQEYRTVARDRAAQIRERDTDYRRAAIYDKTARDAVARGDRQSAWKYANDAQLARAYGKMADQRRIQDETRLRSLRGDLRPAIARERRDESIRKMNESIRRGQDAVNRVNSGGDHRSYR